MRAATKLGHPCARQRQGYDHPHNRVMPKVNALPPVELVRDLFEYEASTGIVTWKNPRTNRVKKGERVGTLSDRGYLKVHIEGKDYRLHRLIWLHVTGEDPGAYQIDHADGDRLNNSFSNLRKASHQENICNSKRRKDNNSGFKGVDWHEQHQKWRARIRVKGSDFYLGLFDTPELAHMAYAKAAAELHGDFARAA